MAQFLVFAPFLFNKHVYIPTTVKHIKDSLRPLDLIYAYVLLETEMSLTYTKLINFGRCIEIQNNPIHI